MSAGRWFSARRIRDKNAPITYQAAKEGTVIISGGMQLDCDWKPYKDGIMVCDIPAARDGKLKFSELYVNGKRQIRAASPKATAACLNRKAIF